MVTTPYQAPTTRQIDVLISNTAKRKAVQVRALWPDEPTMLPDTLAQMPFEHRGRIRAVAPRRAARERGEPLPSIDVADYAPGTA